MEGRIQGQAMLTQGFHWQGQATIEDITRHSDGYRCHQLQLDRRAGFG